VDWLGGQFVQGKLTNSSCIRSFEEDLVHTLELIGKILVRAEKLYEPTASCEVLRFMDPCLVEQK